MHIHRPSIVTISCRKGTTKVASAERYMIPANRNGSVKIHSSDTKAPHTEIENPHMYIAVNNEIEVESPVLKVVTKQEIRGATWQPYTPKQAGINYTVTQTNTNRRIDIVPKVASCHKLNEITDRKRLS